MDDEELTPAEAHSAAVIALLSEIRDNTQAMADDSAFVRGVVESIGTAGLAMAEQFGLPVDIPPELAAQFGVVEAQIVVGGDDDAD